MDTFYKLLGIINRLIWISIGTAIIIGIIALVRVGPKNIVQNVAGSLFGNIDSQTPSGDTTNDPNSKTQNEVTYSPEQLECFKSKLGEARVNELISNNQKPSSQEIVQIKPCLSR